MNEIIKTEAVVLNKLNYGDTSIIVTLFTKDYGKLSAIIKGGRSPKSKIGFIVDPLNHLQVILYKKDSREIQIISGADIISHFPGIKDDLEKLKYSFGIIELVKKLIPEHEVNERLFMGIIRIFHLFEDSAEHPKILFGRFFMFFLTELGYAVQIQKCASCGKSNLFNMELSYNFELGILCNNCKTGYIESYQINPELFNYLKCLKQNKKVSYEKEMVYDKAITFFELYLKHHIPDFNGIKSFQLFKEVR
jgi:DNA repair protein RecO (recombination protein O)